MNLGEGGKAMGDKVLCQDVLEQLLEEKVGELEDVQPQRQDLVENEMKELTAGYQNDKYEFIKQMYCFMNNFAAKSTKCGKNLWSVYFSSSRTVVNVKSCALSN